MFDLEARHLHSTLHILQIEISRNKDIVEIKRFSLIIIDKKVPGKLFFRKTEVIFYNFICDNKFIVIVDYRNSLIRWRASFVRSWCALSLLL